jgi:hypothetical protein
MGEHLVERREHGVALRVVPIRGELRDEGALLRNYLSAPVVPGLFF